MKKIFLLFVFILLISIFVPKKVLALVYFNNNFENQNTSGWNILSGDWVIKQLQGSYRLGAKTLSLPNIINEIQAGDYLWSNYDFSFSILPINGADKNILFRVTNQRMQSGSLNLPVSYGIHWTNTVMELQKFTSQGGKAVANISIGLSNGNAINYRVRLNGNNIKVFESLNINPIINYTDTDNPILNGRIALLITTGGVYPSEVYFDNIVVSSLEQSLEPVVLLPGMGASWNHQAMLFGLPQTQDKWFMTPGITIYDNLISALKNLGYETSGPNRNLFIFNYDWTKPVSQISDDLKNYISNTVKPPTGIFVNLVGHSLGGLTARTYVQNNPAAPVSRLITLGAPEKGVVKAYYLWEGGDLGKSGLGGVEALGAGLLLHLRTPGFSSTAKALQSVIPSFKDLLPTFNYLKKDGQIKPISQMNQINSWLINLNANPPTNLLSVLNSFVGNQTNNTLSFLNVSSADWLNQILGLYPDGKPVSEEKSNGDDTVLVDSAQIQNANLTNLPNLSHGDLVQKKEAIQKILEALGLVPQTIPDSATQNYQHALVFEATANAKVSVQDSQGQNVAAGDGQLMVVPNVSAGSYQVSVTGQENGDYHLYSGQISNNSSLWTTTAGTTNANQTTNYQLNFDPQNLQPIIDTDGQKAKITARTLLKDLKTGVNNRTSLSQINDLIRLLDKNDFENGILGLYRLRQTFNSQNLKNKIQEIINQLEISYVKKSSGSYNQTKLNSEIALAQTLFNQQETKLKNLDIPKKKPEFGNLYLLDQEKLTEAKTANSGALSFKAHIKALGSQFLSQEALKTYK